MKTRLILVRHGQSIGNTLDQLQGWRDGYLTEEGLRQAELMAASLAGRKEIAALYSSPLRRAWQTAEAIARQTGLAPVAHPGLREISFGEAEGLSVYELPEVYPEVYKGWQRKDDIDFGWPGGETRRVFHKRVVDTMNEIAGKHRGETIAVVSHGGALGVYVAHLMTGNTTNWAVYQLDNCSISELDVNGDGQAEIIRLNYCVHVPEGKSYDL
ncbi:MAG: histidine phosphatase family protein [Chloroflexi bacterium]|nr:histidine phosphatase family protein [Chloroflexota bacterium]